VGEDQRPLISTFFAVSGQDFAPDEFSNRVGIKPTRIQPTARRTGTIADTGEPFVLFPTWWIKRTKVPSLSTDEGLRNLLNEIWPKRAIIKELISGNSLDANFGTIVTVVELHPLYSIEPPTLERLAFFGYRWLLDVIV